MLVAQDRSTLQSFSNMQVTIVIEAEQYIYINKWGSEGTNTGQFRHPFGIAMGKDNLVYVSDSYNDRIQVFTTNGTYIKSIGSSGNTRAPLINTGTFSPSS